jgi:OOP family OmpA-OmpF porin
MNKITIVALLSVFVATPVLADNSGKFYVAADFGTSSLNNVTVPAVGGFPAATFLNPGMGRIAVGYHFSPMIAVEVGYSKFADTSLDYAAVGKATLAMNSTQVAAVGSYPLNSQFDLLGKLGVSRNSASSSGTGAFAGLVNSSTSQSDLLIGVGAQYNVSSQFGIRVQYDSFGKFDSSSQPISASAISVGVVSSF